LQGELPHVIQQPTCTASTDQNPNFSKAMAQARERTSSYHS
jgi:hypothetical protein